MQIESRSRTIVLQALQDREWRFLPHVRFVVEFGAGLARKGVDLKREMLAIADKLGAVEQAVQFGMAHRARMQAEAA